MKDMTKKKGAISGQFNAIHISSRHKATIALFQGCSPFN